MIIFSHIGLSEETGSSESSGDSGTESTGDSEGSSDGSGGSGDEGDSSGSSESDSVASGSSGDEGDSGSEDSSESNEDSSEGDTNSSEDDEDGQASDNEDSENGDGSEAANNDEEDNSNSEDDPDGGEESGTEDQNNDENNDNTDDNQDGDENNSSEGNNDENNDNSDETGSDDDEEDEENGNEEIDLCNGVICNDGDECTWDYCKKGRCYNIPKKTCEIEEEQKEEEIKKRKWDSADGEKINLEPEDIRKMLINELSGTSFGIETNKKEYYPGEDVWARVNAPQDADVEILFSYDGFNQYIKIPKEKGYPLKYLLPVPSNIAEGIYSIKGAIYSDGVILKTETNFRIKSSGSLYDYKERNDDIFWSGMEIETDKKGLADEEEREDDDEPEEARGLSFEEETKEDNSYNYDNDYDNNGNLNDLAEKREEEEEEEKEGKEREGGEYSEEGEFNALSEDNTKISDEETIQRIVEEKKDFKEGITHSDIEVGKPVKWTRVVEVENYDNQEVELELLVDVPNTANDLEVVDVNSGSYLATKKSGKDIVINDDLEDKEKKKYVIEFETEAPRIVEEEPVETENEWKKEVIISSDKEYEEEYEYKNVLSYTTIKETYRENIRLFWTVEGKKIDVTDSDSFAITYYDTNDNGMIDKISWITPHLSTQEFEVVITFSPSSGTGLSVTLIEPDGDIFKNETNVDFRFIATYNRSLDIWCNLTVDGNVRESMAVLNGQETIVIKDLDFSEAEHEWNVVCSDELGNNALGTAKDFIIDLTPPVISLDMANPYLSLTDNVLLNFTPDDNFADSNDCYVYLTGPVNKTDHLIVADNSVGTADFNGLMNGTYEWAANCTDTAGNTGSSAKGTIYVDTQREFDIVLNKYKYTLGEGGVYYVTAPLNGLVTLSITTPKPSTVTRTYSGSYPQVGILNFSDYPGTYTIEGYLNYNGAIKTKIVTFDVDNTLNARLSADKGKITPGGSIGFSASASGGLGDITYEWDFGDGSSISTSKTVSHKYTDKGTYGVKLTVTDSKGNKDEDSGTISVEDKYTATILVRDNETGDVVSSAKVYLGEDEKTADGSGQAAFSVFADKFSLRVSAQGYKYYFDSDFLVSESKTHTVFLKKKDDSGETDETKEEEYKTNTDLTDYSSKEQEDEYEENTEENSVSDSYDSEDTTSEDVLIERIEAALDRLSVMDSKDLDIVSALDLKVKLAKAATELKRVKRDFHNLKENNKGLSEEELLDSEREIKQRVKRIEETTITGFRVIDEDKVSKEPEPEEITEVSNLYSESKNISYTTKANKEFIKKNLEAQSYISASSSIKKVEITYLSGDEDIINLISTDIEISNNLTGTKVVLFIPKDAAENTDVIEFITPGRVVNPDPMIEYSIKDAKRIKYYILGDVDFPKLKSINYFLLYDPAKVQFKGGGFELVGFAIFSKIKDIDNPVLVIEVIAVIILLIIYLFYQFDLFEKIKIMFLERNNELKSIASLIKELDRCLSSNETGNAEVVYDDIMKEYKKLSSKSKAKVHKETIELHSRIIYAKIIDLVNESLKLIEDKDISLATKRYYKMQELYKHLPKDYKAKAGHKCHVVFEKIKSNA